MLFEALSGIVAIGCVLASGRRLAMAVAPLKLDPRLVLDALKAGDRHLPEGLLQVMTSDGRFVAERGLFEALAGDADDQREARVGEELTELQGRAQQWARVPRVCVSVATSSGFLFGSIALLHAMALPDAETMDEFQAGTHAALASAMGALAVGIAAASFCAAVHMRARRVHRERMSALSRLVDSGLLTKHL